MYPLNKSNSSGHAISLTKIAIEHGYIQKSNDSEETAKNVYDFYKELFLSFSETKDQGAQ